MKSLLIIFCLFLVKNVRADFLPNTFSAVFTQEYVSTLKGKTKKGNGTIEYKYPGNIRFETNNPTHVLFVTNGTKSWYYNFPFIEGEEGEVTESYGKDSTGFFTKFFDTLKGDLKTNNLFKVTPINKNSVRIIFNEKSAKDTGVKEAVLTFKSEKLDFGNITEIDLEFTDSKKSKMSLSEIKLNVSFEPNKFQFIYPKNTKIIKR